MAQSLCVFNFGEVVHTDDWNFKVPGSVFWRLYRVTSGTARVRLSDVTHILSPGHLYIIPAFTTHEDMLAGTFTHQYLHFRIEDGPLRDLLESYELPFEIADDCLSSAIFSRLASLCRGFELETSIPSRYEKKSSYIYWTKRYMALPVNERFEIDNCVRLLLSAFINAGRRTVVAENPDLRRVKNHIDSRFMEPISIGQLADMAGMRPESFIRAFGKTFRQSPHSYIISKRVNEAKSLLLLTTLSIKEISARTGFSNVSYFCLIFRKHTSMTPGAFRRHSF